MKHTEIREQRSGCETNIISWEDKWYDDGSGYTGWEVFTSSLDEPKNWNTNGWEVSSQCNMGYRTTVWKTNDSEAVKRDLSVFAITPKAFEQLK